MGITVREFVARLERAGELRRITAPASPVLEISAIADLASKSPAPHPPADATIATDPAHARLGGHALLFENVEGSDIPVLINAFGSYRRVEIALGCNDAGPGLEAGRIPGGLNALADRIGELVKPEPPRSMRDAIARARLMAPLLRIGPKRARGRAPCQEVVVEGDEIDLTRLPIIRCWPHDGDAVALGYPAGINDAVPGLGHPGIDAGAWESSYRGRYITLAGIHTIHADDAAEGAKPGGGKPRSHNIGMYRVQLLGKRTMAMHWHVHHDGANHWRSWKRLGKPMPVAVVLGGEAVLPYAATAPLPPGISELLMAGFLNAGGIPMRRARTVPVRVPANAEIVIEGYVSERAGPIGWDPRDPDAGPLGEGGGAGGGAVFEGPFGDHTGFYSLPDRYPVLTVTCVTMRRNPVYPTTVVGLPPQEDYFLGKATERLFLPLLRTIVHDIEDYDLPMFGAFHNAAFLRIRKQYALQGRRVMHSIWGAGQMAWTKCLWVVDDATDVHDPEAVLRAAARHCDPATDIERVRGPLDILDHAAPFLGAGGKIGFDCTPKTADERLGGPTDDPAPAHRPDLAERVGRIDGVTRVHAPASLPGWLFVAMSKSEDFPHDASRDIRAIVGGAQRDGARGAGAGRGARAPIPFVLIVGDAVDPERTDDVLFHLCANFDPTRDATIERAVFIADARPKTRGATHNGLPVRDWPPMLAMDEGVGARAEALRNQWG